MLRPYSELRKIDVSQYCVEREGIKLEAAFITQIWSLRTRTVSKIVATRPASKW